MQNFLTEVLKKLSLLILGKLYIKWLKIYSTKFKRAEKEISRIIDLDRARISIGATSVIGEPLIPRLMKGFSKAHEEIEYDVTIADKAWLF